MANRGTSENELPSVVTPRIFTSCTQEYLYGVKSSLRYLGYALPLADIRYIYRVLQRHVFARSVRHRSTTWRTPVLHTMRNCLLDHHGNRVQHTTLTSYQPRTTDFRSRIRSRLSRVGRNWVATGSHHFRGIVWCILGATRRSIYALYPSGHFVRPIHHGHFDHLLFVPLSTFASGPTAKLGFRFCDQVALLYRTRIWHTPGENGYIN